MKKILILLFIFSCEIADHDNVISHLKSPVVLIGKCKDDSFGWSITVRDSAGTVKSFGNGTILAHNIGASRIIGDTIK